MKQTISSSIIAVLSHQTKAKTSAVSSKRSAKSKKQILLFLNAESGGMRDLSWEEISPLRGELLMLNTSESPRDADACFLSQILMANVPEKYYLSPKACQGILRRASERGKQLPDILRIALERQAHIV